jgi:tetratricopeptide (TPR) repeat protein
VDETGSLQFEHTLLGRRVVFVGKLVSMPRRDAERLVRERGGRVLDRLDDEADLIVVSDDTADLKRLVANRDMFDDAVRSAISSGAVELIHESDFWSRLGLSDTESDIERLYTPAMLAELVHVSVATIRHWQRRGALVAKREVRRLAYFDFEEVRVAQKLAQLLEAGCTLAAVNRRLEELTRLLPGPAAEDEHVAIPFVAADSLRKQSVTRPRAAHPYAAEDLRSLAAELAEGGQVGQAVEAFRALLFSGEFTAEDHFDLAELLYQQGDLSAARERYYMAIELDEDFVEARSNLGCVLAEQGDAALAEAAFRGALEYHPDYVDAHYHLAKLLDRVNRRGEATRHWNLFMNLAPASPWADEARERISGDGRPLSAISSRPDDGRMPDGLADSR